MCARWNLPCTSLLHDSELVNEPAYALCVQPWWRRPKARTTALVNLAGIMERTDEQLLPAVYRFVGASFRATPSELGYLTLSRAMVQALASPVGGILGAP